MVLVVATVAMIVAAGAATPAGVAMHAKAEKLSVFAAASMTDVFPRVAKQFKKHNPKYKNVKFVWNFAGTDTLVAQIESGAKAAEFASASKSYGDKLVTDRYIASYKVFCQDKLCVVVPKDKPGQIADLGDLTNDGVLVAIGGATVPVGRYTRTVLTNISAAETWGSDYSDKVMANVVYNASSVSAVVALVELGESDAGFVYSSDPVRVMRSGNNNVAKINIDNAYQSEPLPTYPIAKLKATKMGKASTAFIKFVMGKRGQKVLKSWGFLPKPAPTSTATAAPAL